MRSHFSSDRTTTMRKEILTAIAGLALISPGCVALRAATRTVKVAGKATVIAAKATGKAITWPFREAMAQQAKEEASTNTVTLGLNDSPSPGTTDLAQKTTDDNVKIAGVDSGGDDSPSPRKSSKKPKVDEAEDSSDSEARRASSQVDDLDVASDDGETGKSSTISKKKSSWRGKPESVVAQPDADTIRIE